MVCVNSLQFVQLSVWDTLLILDRSDNPLGQNNSVATRANEDANLAEGWYVRNSRIYRAS